APRHLPSFPTRRSSDLFLAAAVDRTAAETAREVARDVGERPLAPGQLRPLGYLTDPGALPSRDFQWDLLPTADAVWRVSAPVARSEEHTSELQSRGHLV